MRESRLSLLVSAFALAISGFTLYYNVITKSDDLRIVVGPTPTVRVTPQNEVSIEGDQQLTFINSGDRGVAIIQIIATAFPIPADQKKHVCIEDIFQTAPMSFNADPFVLKAGELVVSNLKMREGFWKKGKDGLLIFPMKYYQAVIGERILVCLHMRFITPDNYFQRWSRAVYEFTLAEAVLNLTPLYDANRPLVIHRRRSFAWN